MYFESRGQAGRRLADQMYDSYRYENCAVIALSVGGVLVAEQIAARLHCVMMLLLSREIEVPGESVSFGSIAQSGNFTFNPNFSEGEVAEYVSEFYNYLEDQKREMFQTLNHLLTGKDTMDATLLRDRIVIVVDDGLDDSSRVDVVLDYLKPVRTERIVVATPFATLPVVDKLHVMADELHILDVKENYINTDHYYEKNDLPDPEDTMRRINEIIMKWQ